MIAIGMVVRLEDGLWLVTAVSGRRCRLAPLTCAGSAAGDTAMVPVADGDIIEGADALGAGLLVAADAETWRETPGGPVVARMGAGLLERLLRAKAGLLAREHYALIHAPRIAQAAQNAVPVAGRVYGAEEIDAVMQSGLDLWLTTGRFNEAFEKRLGAYLGLPHVLTVNSGSSANLLAVTALTSPLLGERALKSGDEVITVAAGFPTTVNPLIQNGLVPVFVDVDPTTLNILPERLEQALGPRTRAVILAHTLGNPFDVAAVTRFCQAHDLWLIEDCCDALGSQYVLPPEVAPLSGLAGNTCCGAFGHIAAFSFYPAHHITMGEGGAVATADPLLKKILESLRDWGRDCWCKPGHDNSCRRRFGWKWGELPEGYDHKYVYSHVGYNLKITDMQAAVGVAQLDRLPAFMAARRDNYRAWLEELVGLEDHVMPFRPLPEADPCWFGLALTICDRTPGLRERLLSQLNEHRIGTRLLFAGNIIKQPAYAGCTYRVAGGLENTDAVMARTFWVGVYPGLCREQVARAAGVLRAFWA